MPQLNDVFNQELFNSQLEELKSFSNETVTDLMEFLVEFGNHPNLDFAELFNTISGREDRYSRSVNANRRTANCFNDAFTAQNSMFCNTLANVLPSIQSSSTSRYL